ncbi:hypothetical protein Q73_09005 [Bacillus coahuilensis m2-6]|uniref:DUF342 domain-containing protein n=1 Tax=Bacillus coahuilensis TaxID=408580 RepID=UPI0007501988|nr:FapA family protein [Bacillus coahuilensis]KUP07351.1 hypothetical protein Q73_09005 [Bacillus coahuilensis m2-6]
MEIFRNETFSLFTEQEDVWIAMEGVDYSIHSFNEILKQYPRIQITAVVALRKALQTGEGKHQIGFLKPIVECQLSKDEMKASIRINCSSNELAQQYQEYKEEVLKQLKEKKITYGILEQKIESDLEANKWVIIAEGKEAVNGNQATVKYIEGPEKKPTINENGTADYYDMNFVVQVQQGDWVGEKTPPSIGQDGLTVTGRKVVAKPGKNAPLNFDRRVIKAVENGEKTVLHAKKEGIIEFIAGKLTVANHLVVHGDVGIETGNIEFDGHVTVKGTVQPGYSVNASRDIAIVGNMGIHHCEKIVSTEGDIFIKGGIFGSEHTMVKAGKNLYLKHGNDCILEADETISVGYYIKGCHVKCRNIHVTSPKGSIIGGIVHVEGMLSVSTLGNRMEKLTTIELSGFDPLQLEMEYMTLLNNYKRLLQSSEQKKVTIEKMIEESVIKDDLQTKLDKELRELNKLEEKRSRFETWLKLNNEGQVHVTLHAFPNTIIKSNDRIIRPGDHGMGLYSLSKRRLHYSVEGD